MADGFEVRITGDKELIKSIDAFGKAIVEEARTAVTVWVRQTRDLAKRNLDKVVAIHGSSATPLRGTIQARARMDGDEAVGIISVGAGHGLVVEKGRKAARIPIAPLVRWASRGGAALVGETDPVRAAYKVSMAARRKARPARPWLKLAVEAPETKVLGEKVLTDAWNRAAKRAGAS